jgi:deoxycytidine triphosphate deaminase
MGALSDTEMRYRLGLTPGPNGYHVHAADRLEVVPFTEMTKLPGHPSYGMGSYGIDLRAGYNWKYLDRHKLAAMGIPYIRPGMKNLPWVTVTGDPKRPSADQLIIIPPRSAILMETLERVRIPRDCWALVAGKSTWARLFIDLNTTPLEPEWEGIITLEATNNSDVAVAVEPGEGFAQMVLFAGNRPDLFPLGTSYADRDNPTYQHQTGVTDAKA